MGDALVGTWQTDRLDTLLTRLSELEFGWDGDGASPVDDDVLRSVKYFVEIYLSNVHAEPWLVPSKNGGVRLEWVSPDSQLLLEIWFSPADFVDYHFRDNHIYPTAFGITRQLFDPIEQLKIPLDRVAQYCPSYHGNIQWLNEQGNS